MRDALRIPIIIDELCHLWKRNPDFRLGQLIGNFSEGTELYYMEDDILIKGLKEFYDNRQTDIKTRKRDKKIKKDKKDSGNKRQGNAEKIRGRYW